MFRDIVLGLLDVILEGGDQILKLFDNVPVLVGFPCRRRLGLGLFGMLGGFGRRGGPLAPSGGELFLQRLQFIDQRRIDSHDRPPLAAVSGGAATPAPLARAVGDDFDLFDVAITLRRPRFALHAFVETRHADNDPLVGTVPDHSTSSRASTRSVIVRPSTFTTSAVAVMRKPIGVAADMAHVEMRAEALMALGEEMLDRFERRRFDHVDHHRRRQHRDAAGADERRGMFVRDNDLGRSGQAGLDAGQVDHAFSGVLPRGADTAIGAALSVVILMPMSGLPAVRRRAPMRP